MVKGTKQQVRDGNKQSQHQLNLNAAKIAQNQQNALNNEKQYKEGPSTRVLKNVDEYRSPADIQSLREEGYEIDYDRLVGAGLNSAVFLAHLINAPPPPLDKDGKKVLYTPGYDIAAKIVSKKLINAKRPMKTRTGNLKLALALGQTKPENNILKVIDVFKTPERIFIFMQYCTFGNVVSFIRRNGQVSNKLAQKWSGQMAIALNFLHKFQVAHRNYKLENVLVDECLNAKLTGFGLSKFCIDMQSKQPILSRTICGSEPYLAPEMLRDVADRYYDPKQADVWAFGVGVFLCVTKRYPFEAGSFRALKVEQLAKRYLERDIKNRIISPVKELLNQTFTIEPNQRPTMQDLCLQSGWLNVSTQVNVSTKPSANLPHPAMVSATGSEAVVMPRTTIVHNRRNRSTPQHKPEAASEIQTPSPPDAQ